MGAQSCRRHGVAALASGVVLSMTAMTGAITPALAEPDSEYPEPTTSVVPTTEVAAEPAAPVPTEAPAVVEAPVPVMTETAAPTEPPAPAIAEPPAPAVTDTPGPVTTETVVSTPTPPAETVTPTEASPPAAVTPVEAQTDSPTTSSVEKPVLQESAKTDPVETTTKDATSSPKPTPSPSQVPSTSPTPSTETIQPAEPTPTTELTSSEEPTTSAELSPGSTASVQGVGKVETVVPQVLQAPVEDVELAKASRVIEEEPAPAPKAEVEAISASLDLSAIDIDRVDIDRDDHDRRWNREVRQWDRDWVSYDEFYRPVLLNPYRDPVRIVYVYQNAPRVVWIPPLARIALEVAEFAAYSFTAIVLNAVNTAVSVAVGSFFGGGYIPAVGVPLPPPPPPVLRYDNVPVQVRYSQAVYEPFRVQRIIDVGEDRVYGERKVLLDGATPAWGVWTQTPSGERQFEVHRTQQFPGLDVPREVPLAGDYRLRLAAEEISKLDHTRTVLYVLGGVVVALGIGALGLCALLGRRSPPAH